jgi:DNA polymerase-3 subunit delta
LSYQKIIADLSKKVYHPVYLLHGEEPFFIDLIERYIGGNVLAESERAFNQIVLYGPDTGYQAVVDQARQYPMMAERQVIIIREAQAMKELAGLEKYLEHPAPTTVLVLSHKHKALKASSKLAKLAQEKGVVFESRKLYDNQIPAWIKEHALGLHLQVRQDAADLMAEYLGTDLTLIVHELEKMALHLPAKSEVTPAHVEEFVGISREYNVFELQKALSQKNMKRIRNIVQYFSSNPKRNPFVLVVASLASYFTKVYLMHFLQRAGDKEVQEKLGLRNSFAIAEYRLTAKNYSFDKTREVISLLREYDLMAKGVDFNASGKDESALLKELIWRILDGGSDAQGNQWMI